MDLNAVADELKARLDTMPGLRAHGHPPASVSPPAGIVSYPERVDYDVTTGRDADRVPAWPLVLVVGRVTERSARERIYDYAAATGDRSIKALLEGDPFASCDVVTVTRCEFDTVTIGAVDYIAAVFTLDIIGSGTT